MTPTERFTEVVRQAGYKSLGQWCKAKKFNRTMTYRTVSFWGDKEKMPQGVTGHRIITALRKLERKQNAQ